MGDFLVDDLQRNVVLVLGGVENLESRELASEERLTQLEEPCNGHHKQVVLTFVVASSKLRCG